MDTTASSQYSSSRPGSSCSLLGMENAIPPTKGHLVSSSLLVDKPLPPVPIQRYSRTSTHLTSNEKPELTSRVSSVASIIEYYDSDDVSPALRAPAIYLQGETESEEDCTMLHPETVVPLPLKCSLPSASQIFPMLEQDPDVILSPQPLRIRRELPSGILKAAKREEIEPVSPMTAKAHATEGSSHTAKRETPIMTLPLHMKTRLSAISNVSTSGSSEASTYATMSRPRGLARRKNTDHWSMVARPGSHFSEDSTDDNATSFSPQNLVRTHFRLPFRPPGKKKSDAALAPKPGKRKRPILSPILSPRRLYKQRRHGSLSSYGPSTGTPRSELRFVSFPWKRSATTSISPKSETVVVIPNSKRDHSGPSTPHPVNPVREARKPTFAKLRSSITRMKGSLKHSSSKKNEDAVAEQRRVDLKNRIMRIGEADQYPDGRVNHWL